jgi:predicted HD phosphohydrolase
VCQLVGAHVWAKRYLTATEPGYYEALSVTSKRTLKYQVRICERLEMHVEANSNANGPGRHV